MVLQGEVADGACYYGGVTQGTAEAAMSFVPISHARKPVYKPRKEDVGHMLKVRVSLPRTWPG